MTSNVYQIHCISIRLCKNCLTLIHIPKSKVKTLAKKNQFVSSFAMCVVVCVCVCFTVQLVQWTFEPICICLCVRDDISHSYSRQQHFHSFRLTFSYMNVSWYILSAIFIHRYRLSPSQSHFVLKSQVQWLRAVKFYVKHISHITQSRIYTCIIMNG